MRKVVRYPIPQVISVPLFKRQKLQSKKQESEVRKQAVKLNRFCQILEIIPWRSLQACQQSLERTYRMITVKVAVDVSLHSSPKDGLGVAYPKKPESNK
jgi:hypothetical protein